MTSHQDRLSRIRRPRLLMHAARLGLAGYRRERDLKRLLRDMPEGRDAMDRLITEEERLETTRTSGAGTYSTLRHVSVLIAILGELGTLAPA